MSEKEPERVEFDIKFPKGVFMANEKSWVHTGSIVDMLERSNVCQFEKDDNGVVVKSGISIAYLHPEMLRFLANELNEMADELEAE